MVRRRKPIRRLIVERSSDNAKRRLCEPALNEEARAALASRARFQGSAKHKLQPLAFGLRPAPRNEDTTYCDGHSDFQPSDMTRAEMLLQRGILAGLTGRVEKHGDPTLLWTVDDNGWIYECRITTPSRAIYHGYPLLLADAFAKMVIARFEKWAHNQQNAELLDVARHAWNRYS